MEPIDSISTFDLVNRETELRSIEDTLHRLTTPNRKLPKQILEFNGIGGIGKTALLNNSKQKCEEIKNLSYSFIDFCEFLEEKPLDLNKVIIAIVQQLRIKNDLSELILKQQSVNGHKLDLTSELIQYLRRILQTTQEETPLALIFDSVDEVDQPTRDWLISIMDNTIDAGKILFAVASKTSLGISKRPNLEKKVFAFRLQELDQEFTLKQLQVFGQPEVTGDMENWVQAVFHLTHGHPLANLVVALEARKRNFQSQNIYSEKYEFARLLDKHVVIDKVFHGYHTDKVHRFKQILTPLAIPRMFNLVSMGKLIERFAPDYAMKSSWHYSNYIRELQAETSFIRYSRENRAYVVNPILRSVFSLMLKQEDNRVFKKLHLFLVDMYSDWIEDAKGTDKTQFFIEKIYHQLELDSPPHSLIPQLQKFSDTLRQKLKEAQLQVANQQFINELDTDPDLKARFNESLKDEIQKLFV